MFKRCFAAARSAAFCSAAALAAFALIYASASAQASVDIAIDKTTQRMTVSVDGVARHVWRVSTGRAGLETPNGHFRPQRMARTWFSRKYYNSPMPYSIFFHGGYAIHGSNEISRLGGPASHGCVRLHPSNAATLFALVQGEGAGSTRIAVTGTSPVQLVRRAPHREALDDLASDADTAPAYGRRAYRPVYVDPGYAPYGAPAYVPYGAAPVYAPAYRPAYDPYD